MLTRCERWCSRSSTTKVSRLQLPCTATQPLIIMLFDPLSGTGAWVPTCAACAVSYVCKSCLVPFRRCQIDGHGAPAHLARKVLQAFGKGLRSVATGRRSARRSRSCTDPSPDPAPQAASRNQHARIFSRQPALRSPDGADPGTGRLHQTAARGRSQHPIAH